MTYRSDRFPEFVSRAPSSRRNINWDNCDVDVNIAQNTKAPRKPRGPRKPRQPKAPRQPVDRIALNAQRAALPTATEDQVLIAVADILRARAVPGLCWYHVPNGGIRHPSVAAKMKAFGTKAGIPDLMLHYAGQTFGLELKRLKGGVVSPEQRQAHGELVAAGCTVAVAKGYAAAIETLERWGLIRPA